MNNYYSIILCILSFAFSTMIITYYHIALNKNYSIGEIFYNEKKYLYISIPALFNAISSLYYAQKLNDLWVLMLIIFLGYLTGYIFVHIFKSFSQGIAILGVVISFFLLPFLISDIQKSQKMHEIERKKQLKNVFFQN